MAGNAGVLAPAGPPPPPGPPRGCHRLHTCTAAWLYIICSSGSLGLLGFSMLALTWAGNRVRVIRIARLRRARNSTAVRANDQRAAATPSCHPPLTLHRPRPAAQPADRQGCLPAWRLPRLCPTPQRPATHIVLTAREHSRQAVGKHDRSHSHGSHSLQCKVMAEPGRGEVEGSGSQCRRPCCSPTAAALLAG